MELMHFSCAISPAGKPDRGLRDLAPAADAKPDHSYKNTKKLTGDVLLPRR